jgi:hypothetical protein
MPILPPKLIDLVPHTRSRLYEVQLNTLASSLARTSSVPLLKEKRYLRLLKNYQDILTAIAFLNEEGQLILNQGFSNDTSLSIVAGTLIYAIERIALEIDWQGDRIWLGSDSVLFRLSCDRYLYLQTQMPYKTRVDELLDLLKS